MEDEDTKLILLTIEIYIFLLFALHSSVNPLLLNFIRQLQNLKRNYTCLYNS